MKTYRLCFLLLAMLMAMPMTVSAKYYPESPTDFRTLYWIGPAPTINNIDSLTKAAEQGDLDAQRKLVHHFMNYSYYYKEQAVEWFTRAARQGDAETQRELGDFYQEEASWLVAAAWFRKAAEQGDVQAQESLGELYAEGKGVRQDYDEALKWYRKAAEQGNSFAQGRLGDFYAEGKGVRQDYAEAAIWYRKEAEQGLLGGYEQKVLCDRFAEGEGVKQDYAEAVKWYSKALENDSNIVDYWDFEKLGDLYAVTHNYTEAAKWYHKAVDKKYVDDSQLKLGLCYATGKGVKQSFDEATKLFDQWVRNHFSSFSEEIDIVPTIILGSLLLLLFILFLIVAIRQNKKRYGLFKSIILAIASTVLLVLSLCLLLFLVLTLTSGWPLIASDFSMFFGFILLLILCFGLLIVSAIIATAGKTTKANSVSAESENETSEEKNLMDGKKGHKVKFYIGKANILSIVAFPLAFFVAFPYYWFVTKALGHEPLPLFFDEEGIMVIVYLCIFLVALILGLVAAPLLHRLIWGWRNSSSRMDWKNGVVATYCNKPLKKSQYIKGVIIPFYILGLLPLLVSPFINSIGTFLFGIIFIATTAPNFMWVWKLRKEPHDCTIQDIKGEYACFVHDEEQPVDNE